MIYRAQVTELSSKTALTSTEVDEHTKTNKETHEKLVCKI